MIHLISWLPMLALLMLLSAFCSAAEAAFFSLTPEQLYTMRKGSVTQRRIVRLMDSSNRLLSTLLFMNLVANMLFFGIISVITLKIQAENATLAGTFSVTALFIMIVLCELLPKALAVLLPQSIAQFSAFPLSLLQWVCTPILPVLNFFRMLSQRLFVPNFHSEPLLDLKDLERAISLSSGEKTSSHRDKKLIRSLLSLSEIRAEEVMRPRRMIPVLQEPVTLHDLRSTDLSLGWIFIQESKEQDAIAKVLDLKQLVKIPVRDFGHIERHALPAIYVPWNLPTAGILEILFGKNVEAAVVVDEFGSTPGVIFRSDILETIFVPDSERVFQLTHQNPIQQISETKWEVSGLLSLRQLCQYFGQEYSEIQDAATLGGLLTDLLQKIPEPGDECSWNGLNFLVLLTKNVTTLRVEVTLTEMRKNDRKF